MSFKFGSLASVTFLAIATTLVLGSGVDSSLQAAPLPTAETGDRPIAQQRILYVNPTTGSDSPNSGQSEAAPLRSITYALQQAESGTTIQLASGQYTAESFPLNLKSGVTLQGNEMQQGQGVVVYGGGSHTSPTFARQNVAIVAAANSLINGVTVSNPNTRGTGIWIESVSATVRNCTLSNNKREGIFVTGSGSGQIENNAFTENGGNGISLAKDAAGEIRGNVFERTGYGIAVGGNATPSIVNNQIRNNRSGIVATQSARPTLQGNTIENNTQYGIIALADAQPIELNNNTLRNNAQDRLLTATAAPTPNTSSASTSSPGTVTTSSSKTSNHNMGVSFSCISQGSSYATIAKRGSSTLPQTLISWTRAVGNQDAQSRCLDATNKLNQIVSSQGGSLDNLVFTVGSSSNGMGICLLDASSASGCNTSNTILTLTGANARNPRNALMSLLTYSITGSGSPVQETAGIPYASLEGLDANLQPEAGLWFAGDNQ